MITGDEKQQIMKIISINYYFTLNNYIYEYFNYYIYYSQINI